MPLGFERLNERTQRPNTHVNFIRTLPGPTSPTALSILNGVAAICYPLMKSHTILVQALEEYPHNREFVGRNFNAGEVIQLVLRDARGRWLPQRMVEMVMVHELAHCKQMNHSKAFWKVRNGLAGELRALWGKGYTGEGLWGRGRDLESGGVQAQEGEVMDVPEHLCGGTYGRRRGKRRRGKEKDKEKVSYAERKQRRILKKFGAGGEVLGADDEEKVKLEGVVPKKGKPKVAGSARGRELRAAAALARFETWRLKGEEVAIKKEETSCDSETEDEFIEGDQHHAAVEVDGKFMFDDKGRALIKICEDEDDNDGDARREMDEIQGLASPTKPAKSPTTSTSSALKQPSHPKPIPVVKTEPSDCSAYPGCLKGPLKSTKLPYTPPINTHTLKLSNIGSGSNVIETTTRSKQPSGPPANHPSSAPTRPTHSKPNPPVSCPICSLTNPTTALTCNACTHVLQPDFVPDHWRCRSMVCKASAYVNAGDTGRCGVCAGLRAEM